MIKKYLICGLGNPGAQYAHTRHNIGFMAIDALRNQEREENVKGKAMVSHVSMPEYELDLTLIRPLSYMNLSGQALEFFMRYKGFAVEQLAVLHDDLELPFGFIRAKMGGGVAGHNGLRSLVACIGSDFLRIRIGIGRPPGAQDVTPYVLGNFTKQEQEELPFLFHKVIQAIALLNDSNRDSVVTHMNKLFQG